MGDAVAIVGAGLVGRAWAIVFARAGWEVRVHDASPAAAEAAPRLIRAGLDELARHGLVPDAAAAAARVTVATSLEATLAGAALVQESLPEDVAVKRKIFAALDAAAPANAILASSTSSIVASRFTADLAGRARCLVAHPVNPPHLVRLVELCGAPWTSAETVARARTLYESVGQVPVVIRREAEGFVLNRLQSALLAEALRLVEDGMISPQDLDRTVKDGLGQRWSFMGPLATIELNAPGGIADYAARYGPFYRSLAADPASPSVWDADAVARVLAEWGATPDTETIAAKSVWRDRRLAALRAHQNGQDEE
jgi:3-hydroxyacyl-CoA dehydrogenase